MIRRFEIHNGLLPALMLIMLLVFALVTQSLATSYICVKCNKEITKQAVIIDGKLFHPDCFRCTGCGKPIRDDYVRSKNGDYYHRDCFERIHYKTCSYCNKVITEPNFTSYENRNYHNDCFKRYVAPRCSICGEGLADSTITDFWGNSFHARHANEFPVCAVCGRLVARDGFEVEAGRWLCHVCTETSVMQPEHARILLEEVREQVANIGVVVTTLGLRIELVSSERLFSSRGASGGSHPPYAGTLWNQGRAELGDETATIFILKGLPEDLMRGVIAHELMHVWQHENGADSAPQDLREGSANWLSSLIYNRTGTLRGRFFINNFEKSNDPVYGAGYRKVARYADSHGVGGVLRFLRQEGAANSKTKP